MTAYIKRFCTDLQTFRKTMPPYLSDGLLIIFLRLILIPGYVYHCLVFCPLVLVLN